MKRPSRHPKDWTIRDDGLRAIYGCRKFLPGIFLGFASFPFPKHEYPGSPKKFRLYYVTGRWT